ncbi:MAG: helix-hairpin-helix domain-containing protein [Rhodovibrio sp.]|nr:helix-hairpin-helix domain-containing protein [Rhodovibrio sp.]
MIADLLRKGLAWARNFFWVAGSSTDQAGTAKQQASAKAAKGERAGDPASGSKSTGQRRPAAAKTSTNKRGTGTAKRSTSQSGGAAAKTSKAKSTSSQTAAPKGTGAKSSAPKATGPKSTGPKSTGPKSTGPGAAEADPAKPGDLSEIKGIGPAIKTKLAQLGIKNFADLAGADANQVAKSLDQRTVTPERVRSWIAEAKKRS